MFRAPPRPSSGAYNCIDILWFYRWNVVVAVLLVVVSTTTNNAATTTFQDKTRGCQCSCKLLMMGVEAPETCWAIHKRQVINLWNCCIWFVNLFELYDDARTCQSQRLKHITWHCRESIELNENSFSLEWRLKQILIPSNKKRRNQGQCPPRNMKKETGNYPDIYTCITWRTVVSKTWVVADGQGV
jgi:hypothetical protein